MTRSEKSAHASALFIGTNAFEDFAFETIAYEIGIERTESRNFDVTAEELNDLVARDLALVVLVVSCQAQVDSGRARDIAEMCATIPVVIILAPHLSEHILGVLPDNVVGMMKADSAFEIFESVFRLALSGIRMSTGPKADRPGTTEIAKPVAHAARPSPHQLTTRESEVAELLSRGAADKEIARELGIALNTVHVHVSAVKRKLDVKNRTQVALVFRSQADQPTQRA